MLVNANFSLDMIVWFYYVAKDPRLHKNVGFLLSFSKDLYSLLFFKYLMWKLTFTCIISHMCQSPSWFDLSRFISFFIKHSFSWLLLDKCFKNRARRLNILFVSINIMTGYRLRIHSGVEVYLIWWLSTQ